jgi:hypothetical protein
MVPVDIIHRVNVTEIHRRFGLRLLVILTADTVPAEGSVTGKEGLRKQECEEHRKKK